MLDIAVPEYAQRVLRSIQAVFPEAVIAGGFLRDLAIGIEPKDLDVFVGPHEREDFVDTDPFGDNFGTPLVSGMSEIRTMFDTVAMAGYAALDVRNECVRVFNAVFDGCPVPVQIISLSRVMTPMETLERMDFDACQVAFTGQAERPLVATAGFEIALAAKRAIYRLPAAPDGEDDKQLARSERRAERWAERFPRGWAFELSHRTIRAYGPFDLDAADYFLPSEVLA